VHIICDAVESVTRGKKYIIGWMSAVPQGWVYVQTYWHDNISRVLKSFLRLVERSILLGGCQPCHKVGYMFRPTDMTIFRKFLRVS
jgi:hypothetical protein